MAIGKTQWVGGFVDARGNVIHTIARINDDSEHRIVDASRILVPENEELGRSRKIGILLINLARGIQAANPNGRRNAVHPVVHRVSPHIRHAAQGPIIQRAAIYSRRAGVREQRPARNAGGIGRIHHAGIQLSVTWVLRRGLSIAQCQAFVLSHSGK